MLERIKEHIWLHEVEANHNADAFAKLYDLYAPPIFRFVVMRVNQREEAEDITSSVFLKAWQHLTAKKTSKITNLRAFLYQVARNAIVDAYRVKGKKEHVPLLHAETLAHPMGKNEVEMQIDHKTETDQLMKHIQGLKHEYRDAVYLRFVEGYSISEIAIMLGKTNANVRVTLHRGLKKIQDAFPDIHL